LAPQGPIPFWLADSGRFVELHTPKLTFRKRPNFSHLTTSLEYKRERPLLGEADIQRLRLL